MSPNFEENIPTSFLYNKVDIAGYKVLISQGASQEKIKYGLIQLVNYYKEIKCVGKNNLECHQVIDIYRV